MGSIVNWLTDKMTKCSIFNLKRSRLLYNRTFYRQTSIHTRNLVLAVAIVLLVEFVRLGEAFDTPWLMRQAYCQRRPRGNQCCPGRDDKCTVPIADTYCYCDMFCRRSNTDCCPDFQAFCLQSPVEGNPIVVNKCSHNGRQYKLGRSVNKDCNKCTCEETIRTKSKHVYDWRCANNVCLMRDEIVQRVNAGRMGWTATKYSFLQNLTLDEGMKYRLGTIRPHRLVSRMRPMRVHINEILPGFFDARTRWRGMIHPIQDQGNCGASWAFSTTSVASDRLTIHSHGGMRKMVSPQQLVSCNTNHQRGCNGGHLDRAWFYFHRYGLVDKECYPYKSGFTNDKGVCRIDSRQLMTRKVRCPQSFRSSNKIYQSTPAYRINSNKEEEIMKEIMDNGPVQATIMVKEDFFSYKRGVYSYSHVTRQEPDRFKRSGYHSVKIVGWGVDASQRDRPVKYWICANSWGTGWGENGYFRIKRGTNECQIESFIIGAWAKVNGRQVLRNPSSRRSLRSFRDQLKRYKRKRKRY